MLKSMLSSAFKRSVLPALFLLFSSQAAAGQFVTYDNYEIHYNAFNSTFIQPNVAQAVGFQRSKRKALINVSVLRIDGDKKVPVNALVSGQATSLIQTEQSLRFKKVDEGNAIYYLSDFGFTDDQVLRFKLEVQPDPNRAPYSIQFEQRFYVD